MLPFELTKDTPYLALSGELWSVFYEYFNRNWLCYKGFLLYLSRSVYFLGSHWISMGLPEISRVTWQVCISVAWQKIYSDMILANQKFTPHVDRNVATLVVIIIMNISKCKCLLYTELSGVQFPFSNNRLWLLLIRKLTINCLPNPYNGFTWLPKAGTGVQQLAQYYNIC